ncbi:MAG: four helix bundle protein [Anaerolineae bacterium]|nr:four helix bundle protein [Anaerolineae bacterium]
MAGIERFEDIKSWQKGRELCKIVYAATHNRPFSQDWGLRDQFRRAAASIVSNIAEGFESQNNRTFVRYLYIAKASCGEVRAQAYIALDQAYLSQTEFDTIYRTATETSRLLAGFIDYLQKHLDR